MSIESSMSAFDLFCIGVGPSSSHTVGPMRAANRFVRELNDRAVLDNVDEIICDLYGSLALTGKGHWTDRAIILGLSGETPEGVDTDRLEGLVEDIVKQELLPIPHDGGRKSIRFVEPSHLCFHYDEVLPEHPNGIRFRALANHDSGESVVLFEDYYFSVGGGSVFSKSELSKGFVQDDETNAMPFPFSSGADLLSIGKQHGLSIPEIMWRNEKTWRDDEQIETGLMRIRDAMFECIDRGCRKTGLLPGGLNIKRRANEMHRSLSGQTNSSDPLIAMDWVSMYALAVNEENAAGGRVVTAPTNGAAGVIPAVLRYYATFCESSQQGVMDFLLTAGAIGLLYKINASVSAAEMGCQGEIGTACSMAAGALAAALGGTNEQIENAAEIGMEHNLGLTCDPVGGLVQVPCIERNTMGAIKAINAARLALKNTDQSNKVSLDEVIETMRQTGLDMQTKYKETSLGGLAVNIVEC